MDNAGLSITVEAVAREAEVSRSWLYSQPDLRAEIERLRERTRPAAHTSSPTDSVAATPPCCAGLSSPVVENRARRARLSA
jgi:hypothetical protein